MKIFHKLLIRFADLPPWIRGMVTATSIGVTAQVNYLLWSVFMTGHQKYHDIIVGGITVSDSYKTGDFFVIYSILGVFFLSWLVLMALAVKFSPESRAVGMPKEDQDSDPAASIAFGVLTYALTLLLIRKGAGNGELVIGGLLLCAFLVPRLLPGVVQPGPAARVFAAGVALLPAAAFFAFFSLLGFVVLGKFVHPALVIENSQFAEALPLYGAGAAFLAGAFSLLRGGRGLRSLVRSVQVPTPLLYLAGFTRVYAQKGILYGNIITVTGKLAAFATVFIGLWFTLRAWRRTARAEKGTGATDIIFRPAVVAVAAFLGYATPIYLNFDYFHYGELLLAWQQVFELGQFPFSGFAVARGFQDAFPGLLNVLFFEGTFASFMPAFSLTGMIITGISAFFLCRLIGTGWGSVFSFVVAAIPLSRSWLYLPLSLVLAHPALLARPLLWLLTWLIFSTMHCLYQTTTGVALTIGTFPVAAWMLYVAFAQGHVRDVWRYRRKQLLVAAALTVMLFLLASPLLKAWVSYVMEQGAANEIANGTPFGGAEVPAWFRWRSLAAWESLRIGGWLLGLFLLWHLLTGRYLTRGRERNDGVPSPLAVLSCSGIVSAIVFIPYSMGRIDLKELSRPGAISMLLLGIILPLVLVLGQRRKKLLTVVFVSMLLGVVCSTCYTSPADLTKRAAEVMVVPADTTWVEGKKLGLPNLGDMFVPQDKLDKIMILKRVTDAFLRPGESYLDLTNNLAFYYFLNMNVPGVYAGYYIATSQQVQERIVRALAKNPPPLVWAGPARTFGSGTAALRSYRLYRWLIQQGYQPMEVSGAQFLVRKDRYQHLKGSLADAEYVSGLVDAFPDPDLAFIPVSWGRSYPVLSKRFEQMALPVGATTTEPGQIIIPEARMMLPSQLVSMQLKEPVDGGRWDFIGLTITAKGPSTTPLKVKIGWAAVGALPDAFHSVTMMARSGTPLLVPVGATPSWLLTSKLALLSIEVADPGSGGGVTIGPVTLLSLKQ